MFEEQLDKLFVSCSTCHKPIIENSKTLFGSMVVLQSSCVDGHNRWQSQPTVNGRISGNMMIAASILVGNPHIAYQRDAALLIIPCDAQNVTHGGDSQGIN